MRLLVLSAWPVWRSFLDRRLFSRPKQHRQRPARAAFPPRLEVLEDRIALNGGTLFPNFSPTAPAVANVSPAAGSVGGGVEAVITGAGFTGATAVAFGATAATTFTVVSDTLITAVAPAETSGAVDVSVTTPGGVSASSTADQFTYVATPAVHIVFDFSKDVNGFFNDPARRQILQLAADNLTADMTNNLAAIVPANGNTWQITFDDPAGNGTDTIINPTIPANTLVVYAGGQNLPADSTELGEGGYGGYSETGSNAFLSTVATRGQSASAFSPWGGDVTFTMNPNGGWYFGTDASQIDNQNDFYSVATHELGHLLGIGTSPQWYAQVSAGAFTVAHAEAVYGNQPVPLDQSEPQELNGHWAQSDLSNGQQPVMTPVFLQGTRKLFTELDYAGLADLGWQFQGVNPGALIVTSISPSGGWTAGGTSVTITGADLANATGVYFGTIPANFTVNSATQITAVSPAGAAGAVDVIVTISLGPSATSSADQFTFIPVPAPVPTSPSSPIAAVAGYDTPVFRWALSRG